MIIDLILDRMDGEPYCAKKFYNQVMEYESIKCESDGYISRAMDCGMEKEVKNALYKYIDENNYNSSIKGYIMVKRWTEDDDSLEVLIDSIRTMKVGSRITFTIDELQRYTDSLMYNVIGIDGTGITPDDSPAVVVSNRIKRCILPSNAYREVIKDTLLEMFGSEYEGFIHIEN